MSEPPTATLVACSDGKRDSRTVSWQLYDSTLFQKSWGAAMLCGDPYVMSAEHHLLAVDERVDHYDTYLGDLTKDETFQWGRTVVSQLPSHYDRVVLFGGRSYVEPIKCAFDDGCYDGGDVTVVDPYRQTTGNGQQMAVAGEIIQRRQYGYSVKEAITGAVLEVCEE